MCGLLAGSWVRDVSVPTLKWTFLELSAGPNSCYFCLSLLVLLMIACMNTYLLSPNHCYNWAPCLGVRLSWLSRSDVSQVTLACKHLASFTFDIQLLWNCGLAKPRGVNRETGSDPCRVSQLVSTRLSPVRSEISAHLKEGRLLSMCFL